MYKVSYGITLGALMLAACAHGSESAGGRTVAGRTEAETTVACAQQPAETTQSALPARASGPAGGAGYTPVQVSSRPLYSGEPMWLDMSGCSDVTGSQGPRCQPGAMQSLLVPRERPKTRCSPEQATLEP